MRGIQRIFGVSLNILASWLEKAQQTAAAFLFKYEKDYPTACECLKRDLDEFLAFYSFPKKHWRSIRTSNAIERLFQEVKKQRSQNGRRFPQRRQLFVVILCGSSQFQI